MNSKRILVAAMSAAASALLFAQAEPPRLPAGAETTPPLSVQAPLDAGYGILTATCKTPPPARGRGPAGGNRGGAPGGGRAAAPPAGVRAYEVKEIPGVIKAGQKWTFHWQQAGNNGDGIVGLPDGSVLAAQNDNSAVIRLWPDGHTTVQYANTRTGGAVSINAKGNTYIVERGLHQRIEQLTPTRRVLADSYNGEPIDCVGGVLNDIVAAKDGGVYFTMGGLFHADKDGNIKRFGENLTTNGVTLSPDEKTLYVTNGATVAAFDVQADGSLTNQREFGKFTQGGGDGGTVDAQGRVYFTSGAGVEVFDKTGKNLGVIPTPRGVITTAFGGKDRKTLFILARGGTSSGGEEVANVAQIWSIPMVAQGFKGRAK